MANNYKLGIPVIAVFAMMLLFTSSAAAVPSVDSIKTNTLGSNPNMEFASIVAGIGSATYNEIVAFGANDGSNFPAGTAGSPGFSEAAQWVVVYSHQDGFSTYLTRRPLDVADGLTLYLLYPHNANSFDWAGNARSAIASLYGVQMGVSSVDTNAQWDTYVFYNNTDVFSSVAGQVAGISDAGFGTAINANTVSGSSVAWAAYGARYFTEGGSNQKVSLHGAGWVNTDGVTSASDPNGSGFIHTISTSSIGSLTAINNAADGLSRVRISVPYPIKPVANGISPYPTSNPLPQVTGRMVWDLRHPTGDVISPASEYKVTFKVGMDRNFPDVSNEFKINQTLLNEGTLKADFNLTATGADAHNIQLRFPLGTGFGDIAAANLHYYRIKPAYSIMAQQSSYSLDVSTTLGSYSYNFFDLTGWFTTDNVNPANWSSTTDISIYNNAGQTVSVHGSNGFPQVVVDALNNLASDASGYPADLQLLSKLNNLIKSNLPDYMVSAFNTSFHEYFEPIPFLVVNGNDFTLQKLNVANGPASTQDEWFMVANVPLLAKDTSTNLTFNITGIPSRNDAIPFLQFNVTETTAGGQTVPKVSVSAENANYDQFMKYAFQLAGVDGRPLSVPLPSDFSLDFNSFADTYGSLGMTFRYEDANGYQFFGLSNGQNIQIADDEAVLSAVVSLDKQVYNPGDNKVITATVTNNGDIAAGSVVVHFFQSTIGRGNQLFERVQSLGEKTIGTLNAGASTSVTLTAPANSFVGYSPVFAIVDFVSDVGQGPTTVPNFLSIDPNNPGSIFQPGAAPTIQFEPGGQTHQFVMSTLAGALLVPESDVQAPTIPEANLKVDVSHTDMNQDGQVTYTYTITNDGNAATKVTMLQYFDPTELNVDLPAVTVPGGATKVVVDSPDANIGLVTVDGLSLGVGESVDISVVYTDTTPDNGFSLPPATFTFTMDGQSSLGDSVNVVPSPANAVAPLLGLSAGAAAQQQSQQSATQDSQSASYSASTSVGAASNVEQNTSTQTAKGGFLGFGPTETLALMLIPLSFVGFLRKRK